MSEPSALEVPLVGDVQPGDRWFVASVDQAAGTVRFERVRAQPGHFRGLQPDGLWPRLPPAGSRPITDEEARALADEMDRSMAEHGRRCRDAVRAENERWSQAMQAELAAAEGPEPTPQSPFSDLDCEDPREQVAAVQERLL